MALTARTGFVAAVVLLTLPAMAQPSMQDRWPGGDPPAAQPAAPPSAASKEPREPKTAKPAGPPRVVNCAGAFVKNSSHLQLATIYGSENLTFTEVDGPQGSKIPGSVLFPKDPKRRLEVLWNDPAGRRDTQVIDINGQSTWTAPKGIKLGLTLAAVEKLNGKPFALLGFGQEDGGMVQGWNGGALENLPGGCKLGIRFAADSKLADDARAAVTGTAQFTSEDAKIRAAKPTIVEILIGYPQ